MRKIQLSAWGAFTFMPHAGGTQWILQRGTGGAKALPVRGPLFVIGRSPDCQLVLPNEPDLLKTTSRWHCHLREVGGGWVIADGSAPETSTVGKPKPSVSGTWRNGRRVGAGEELVHGDEIAVGPWRLRVEELKEAVVDIDALLTRVGSASPRDLQSDGERVKAGFAQLHELLLKLNEFQGADESLAAILEFAMARIPAAQVAAIVVQAPGGDIKVRLAWSRASGRLQSLRLSSGLVRGLPGDRAFLLAGNIADATKSQMAEDISSGLLVPLTGRQERLGIMYMDNRNSGTPFSDEDLYLANALASLIAFQLVQERQVFLSRVEQNMSHYFGPDVVRLILEETRAGRPVIPGAREKEATVMFIDLQGFSEFCRGKEPQRVSEILNAYFELSAECIQRHGGHLDKFIGDGVMGVFGAQPFDPPAGADANHAAQALRAARDLIKAWSQRSGLLSARLPLRIGVNTGTVLVGNVGYAARMEYSVIGDTVNLASRMEKLAQPNGVAFTEATRLQAGKGFSFEDGGSETVKGFGEVRVWRL